MLRRALAIVVAMGVACPAWATTYTVNTSISYNHSDDLGNGLAYLAFVPNFDSALGTLSSLSFTLTGRATQTSQYYMNTPPASGSFVNSVIFNNDTPIYQSTVPLTRVSPTTISETFTVNASINYPLSYYTFNTSGTGLAVEVTAEGTLPPPNCCDVTSVSFNGTLATSYTYAPVPEPISASLILVPTLAVTLRRRIHQSRPAAC